MIFSGKIISQAKKNQFWYSLIAFLLYIGSLSLPCFSFCTLSTCYWIALCQIKDYPQTSIWQIYPTFFFFYKKTGHFHNIYWTQVMLLQLLELLQNLFKNCSQMFWNTVLSFVFDENQNVGIRQKFGMMSNINVHKIHLPGQCSFGFKVILMLLCRVGTGAYP